MLGPSPEGSKAQLSVGVHGRFLEDAFSWMKELEYEWVVEAWLPFLNQGKFQTTVVGSLLCQRRVLPNVQIVVPLPIAKGQFSLDKLVIGQLEKLSGATVFAIQSMVHCRPNIEFGLHVHNVREANVDALGKEKCFCKKIVGC